MERSHSGFTMLGRIDKHGTDFKVLALVQSVLERSLRKALLTLTQDGVLNVAGNEGV